MNEARMGEEKRARGRPKARPENELGQWIEEKGKTREEIAEALGVSLTHLQRLITGTRRPGLELALKIEEVTDGAISAKFWQNVPPHSKD